MILRSLGIQSRAEAFSPVHPRDPQLMGLFGWGAATAAGVAVTPDRAMQSVAVYACVRVIAETAKQVPLILYKRAGERARVQAIDHPIYNLLRRRPNRFQTAAEWKEMMQAHVVLRGNAYSEIIATGGAGVAELVPLHPDRVTPFWAPDGQRAYAYADPKGGQRIILQSEMFHIMGISFDGLKGITPVQYMRNAIGLDLAQEEFAGASVANGVRPSGALQSDKVVGEDGIKNLRKQFEDWQAGARNAGKPLVLEDGLKWEQMGLSLEDAEFLDSRKFSVEQIARIFRVPPHLIGDLDRATFSNIEQQSLEFVQFTMMPWFVTWEDAVSRDLLGPGEVGDYFAEFLVDALLRADLGTRMRMYIAGRQWGWYSANDVRAKENENPIDNGDIYLQPVNMASAQQLAVSGAMVTADPAAITADDVKSLIQEALNARSRN